MIVSVHQPQYLPWLGYFDKISRSDRFVFLDEVQYKEREFQNRNKIRTDKGALWLTVPVISKGKGKQKINEVLIDNQTQWKRKHWESLKAWYGQAAFFKEYCGFFEDIYSRGWQRLLELNVEIIRFVLGSLSIDTPIVFESDLKTTEASTDRIIQICRKLGADGYLSGSGGRQYLQEEKFSRAGIRLMYQQYQHPAYHQLHMKAGDDFMAYLSIVDLLFNHGPQARNILLGDRR